MANAAAVAPLSMTEPRVDTGLLFPAASIFHEPWWLDIATDGQWTELLVEDGGAVARLRHALELSNGRLVSRMPTLVRGLGPEFFGLHGKPVTIRRHKMALARKLIEGLSGLAHFEQVFDPRVEEASMFSLERGFTVSLEYGYRIAARTTEEQRWAAMTDKVRNTIHTASHHFEIVPIKDANLFCDFHDASLRGVPNFHGPARMRRLVTAIQTHRAGQMFGTVDKDGELAAAMLLVWDEAAVRNLIVARDRERAGNGALSLLLSHGMRVSADRGVDFDLDGAAKPGQWSFLSGFGADLVHRLLVTRTDPGYLPPYRPWRQ
jgi:hypothetical protein